MYPEGLPKLMEVTSGLTETSWCAGTDVGTIYKIRQDHVRYGLRKFSFSNRVRTVWNSLSL